MKPCTKARIVVVKITKGDERKFAYVSVPIDDSEEDFLAYAKAAHPKSEVMIAGWGRDLDVDGEPQIYISNMEAK